MADELKPRTERRMEIVATVLLAVAALAAAWSGYQGSLWDGIQSSNYTKASGMRTRAAQQLTEANQFRLADLSVFENYLDATLLGQTELANFYEERFRDEFQPAFDAWIALGPLNNPDAPPSPLAMPEYKLAADKAAADLTAQADATFDEGEDANTVSDIFVLTTLFFASVLFLAAISERLEVFALRVGLLSVAGAVFITGVVVALTQPVTTG
jgi:hypothetical protein